jgi:hypothetical protein
VISSVYLCDLDAEPGMTVHPARSSDSSTCPRRRNMPPGESGAEDADETETATGVMMTIGI